MYKGISDTRKTMTLQEYHDWMASQLELAEISLSEAYKDAEAGDGAIEAISCSKGRIEALRASLEQLRHVSNPTVCKNCGEEL